MVLVIATGVPIIVASAQDEPVLISPEVRPDRTIVFRYRAPKANDVQLSGDWMAGQPMASLERDEWGLWTVTVGPLEPNMYAYAFYVDGTRTDDPLCRCTYSWGGGRGSSSRFTVPSQPAAPWENQNRPTGTLHHDRFYSRTQQRTRGSIVYTPPGYDSSPANRRYPVLVLLPGTPGDATDWTSGGGFVEINPRQPDRRGHDDAGTRGDARVRRRSARGHAPRRRQSGPVRKKHYSTSSFRSSDNAIG
jgi:enterochelin esterase family protein